MNIRILPNCPVGAYRIRPENIHVDQLAHSGVCDTFLQEMFTDIQFLFCILYIIKVYPTPYMGYHQHPNKSSLLLQGIPFFTFLAAAPESKQVQARQDSKNEQHRDECTVTNDRTHRHP